MVLPMPLQEPAWVDYKMLQLEVLQQMVYGAGDNVSEQPEHLHPVMIKEEFHLMRSAIILD